MKKISLGFLFIFSFVLMLHPVTTFAAEQTVDEVITAPYADSIGWRYQMIDGKLHKRQYNYTQEKWIGSWVLA
ncbi:hypothetical protein [Enterococcus sp.]|uniref:hypothetical protein n=1 Tax=Enterococcus sp. TaxID=35783 RepID=UPI002FC672EA